MKIYGSHLTPTMAAQVFAQTAFDAPQMVEHTLRNPFRARILDAWYTVNILPDYDGWSVALEQSQPGTHYR